MTENDKNLISVIIPLYNAEKYLKNCITSVVGQTYRNLEIILVDDGSNDNSLSICEKFALQDNRIKVFHQNNGGVASARNKGLFRKELWDMFHDSIHKLPIFHISLRQYKRVIDLYLEARTVR